MMRAILYTLLYENGGCYALCLEDKMLDTIFCLSHFVSSRLGETK